MLFLFVWKKSDHKSRKSEKNPIIKLMFFFFLFKLTLALLWIVFSELKTSLEDLI